MMERIYAGQVWISRALVIAAGWAFFLFAFVVTTNVLLRKFFSFSIQGTDEYGGYALAIAASIGFAQAAIKRVHIRVDILTLRLPEKLRSLFVTLALITLLMTLCYIFYMVFGVVAASWLMGSGASTALRTPLWIPQGLWALAIGWSALVVLVQALISTRLLVRGHWDENIIRFDTPSVEEEVSREVGTASLRLPGESDEAHQ